MNPRQSQSNNVASYKTMLSPLSNRIFYFEIALYDKVKGLLAEAQEKLNAREFYQLTDLLCKMYSFDSQNN